MNNNITYSSSLEIVNPQTLFTDGYELTNLKHQIFGLTGRKVYGAIPYNSSFTIESYVENFPNFVDMSNLGLEHI